NYRARLVAKLGRYYRVRLTPPEYRNHDEIAAKGVRGGLITVLAQECMEQLYDDNPDAKFGSIAVLSFSRLHHINLHYLEAELAAELARVVDRKSTTREQLLR